MPKRSCRHCKHNRINYVDEVEGLYCTYGREGEFISNYQHEIPDWCPLEDEPKQVWISVKDELPTKAIRKGVHVDYSEYVLIYVEKGMGCNIALYDFCQKKWVGKTMWTAKMVTHWMPLPELPKECNE